MLKFYGPALGIFLAGPLMSNIDNAIVGRAAGVSALAALSPGTVLADQVGAGADRAGRGDAAATVRVAAPPRRTTWKFSDGRRSSTSSAS